MKKNLLSLFALVGLMGVAFVGCDDDDDDNGQSTPVGTASYVGEGTEALQVAGAADYTFSYDENGVLTAITGSGSTTYTITSNPYTITKTDKWGDKEVCSDFRFNEQGYITSLKFAEQYTDEETNLTAEVEVDNISFGYNADGQMSSVYVTSEYFGDVESYNSATVNITLTYKDGDLISISKQSKESGTEIDWDGELKKTSYTEEYTETTEVVTSDKENKYRQLVANVVGLPLFKIFGPLGWYGKGTAHYISRSESKMVTTKTVDGVSKEETEEDIDSYTVKVNDDGFVTEFNGYSIEYAK